VRLITWNVNGIRARLPRVLELLASRRPDVLALQELKCGHETFPTAALERAGYRAAAHCGGRWAGVVLLARGGLELADVRTGLPADPDGEGARWVEAAVDGLRVASVYVPNGRTVDSPAFAEKLAFLEAMAARLADADAPDLVLGDLNVARTDADVWDPRAFVGSTHVTAEERALLEALLVDHVDAYRYLEPDRRRFTWWDYRAGSFHRDLGMRLDYVLVREPLAGRLVACDIDRDFRKGAKPSDHAPLIADLHGSATASAPHRRLATAP
jgi:exodeoxyribonuclease III